MQKKIQKKFLVPEIKLGRKKSLLLICKVLKLFVKALRKARLHRTL